MLQRFNFTMRDEVGELARCLRTLEENEAYQEMPPALRFVTELVLDELISNTIKYGGPGPHEITVTVDWTGQQLRVRIVDDALPFNPWEQSAMGELDDEEERTVDTQSLKVGGRGLQMLRLATDTRDYERIGGRNTVTVTRHLRRSVAA